MTVATKPVLAVRPVSVATARGPMRRWRPLAEARSAARQGRQGEGAGALEGARGAEHERLGP